MNTPPANAVLRPAEPFLLDDRIRDLPPGTQALHSDAVASQSWHPAEGRMALPVLALDEWPPGARKGRGL